MADVDDWMSPLNSERDLDLFCTEEAVVTAELIGVVVSCKSSVTIACGDKDEESLLENEEWALELIATPLSGLCLFLPLVTTLPTGLLVGETQAGCGCL